VPIRIYALAKDLQVDSKKLVELCAKAGITGKGSALASLEDAEVEKVKAFMAGGTAKKPAAVKAAPAPAAKPADKPTPTTATTPTAPAPPREFTRDDYITPGKSGKIKVLGNKSSSDRKAEKSSDDAQPGGAEEPAKVKKKPREPVINLAKLPDVKQPTEKKSASNEPPAQKPEIRLPKDAIAGHKKGTRAPLEHLTKSIDKSKSPVEKKSPAVPKKPGTEAPAPLAKTGARGRRPKGRDEEVDRSLAGMASARADRQKARKTRARTRSPGEDEPQRRSRPRRTLTRKGTNTAAPRKGLVSLELPCTVRTFSEAAGVASSQVQRVLMGLGVMANINSQIAPEYVELVAAELGVELEFKQKESLEESHISQLEHEDDPDLLHERPPIITFLGHVDHGKTSLLDRIIGIDVVSGEAGGITQHIRAYTIDNNGRAISFVDTPGHEAFTEMRARGANVTDIAVLVVAGDDGVMPQTEEAISHAKAAGVPIVVALNKMDLPGVDLNHIYQQLAAKDLLPSEWGGDIEVVKTSALKGEGIDDLLETLLTIAELHEYRANSQRPALGVCLEAQQEQGRGVVAKLMVRNGTLRVGDIVVCGAAFGRVKAMYNTLQVHQKVSEAGPSTPVNVTGFDTAPQAGDTFHVMEDISVAREIAEQRGSRSHAAGLSGQTTKISFERFQELLADGRIGKAEDISTLNLIIRADVQGSVEAILKELGKLDHPEVQVKVLQASVGGITVGDVQLANASDAVIVGFNVIPDEAARSLADERAIEIRRYDVIYKLTDDIRALLEGKLKPAEKVVELGRALVKQVFPISRVGVVAGCYVAQGSIQRGCRIRVNRDGRTIGDYPLESLRREKEDTKEVPRGLECGIKLSGFNDIKQDDILEAYRIEEVARTL